MGIQDDLKGLAEYRRECFDLAIDLMGTKHQMIQIRQDKDKYSDVNGVELVEAKEVEVFVDIPQNVPLDRLRTFDNMGSEIPTRQASFFDVLPLEVYGKFTDNYAQGDILVKPLHFEHANQRPYYLVLEIADAVGNFESGYMTYIKFNAAPCTKALGPLIRDYLELQLGVTQQINP